MRLPASCASRTIAGVAEAVLLLGRPGSGKSDLLLRLIQRGFTLVADDQVIIENNLARPPASLAGLLEVRGLGIFRMAYASAVPLRLVVRLGVAPARLPEPETYLNLPLITLDAVLPSAPERVILALDAAVGRVENLVGAFAA